MSSNIRLLKICQECGIEFIAKTTVTKNCSNSCAKKAWKKKEREKKIKKTVEKDTKVLPQLIKYPVLAQKEILSIQETCTFIGISRPTFYKLIKNKTIETIRLGNRVFITRKEINKVFKI